jgi:hypothetical protein
MNSNVNWLYAKVMSAHRNDVARRVAMLYGYETQGRRRSELVLHPQYQVEPGLFAAWLHTKNFVTQQMLMAHKKWFKEGDHGYSHVISFLRDGTLVECAAGNQDVKWRGTWTLSGGVLRLHLGDYISDYLAKSNNRLTGAEELSRGRGGFNAYFILKPLGV